MNQFEVCRNISGQDPITGDKYEVYESEMIAWLKDIKKKLREGEYEIKIGSKIVTKKWHIFTDPNKNYIDAGSFGIYHPVDGAVHCSFACGAIDVPTYKHYKKVKKSTRITKKVK